MCAESAPKLAGAREGEHGAGGTLASAEASGEAEGTAAGQNSSIAKQKGTADPAKPKGWLGGVGTQRSAGLSKTTRKGVRINLGGAVITDADPRLPSPQPRLRELGLIRSGDSEVFTTP